MVKRFKIIYRNGAYCSTKPDLNTDEVVSYSAYAKLAAENERLKKEVENWKTSAAGWQKIASVDAVAHTSTGAVKVDRQRLNIEISKWATDSDLHITIGDVGALHEAVLSALEPAAPEIESMEAYNAATKAMAARMANTAILVGDSEPAAPEAFVYRDENGQPQVQRTNETCKCDPVFHEYHDDGVKHCRSCDAEWHPPLQAAPEGQQPVDTKQPPEYHDAAEAIPASTKTEGQQEPVAWIYRRRDGTTVVTRDDYADWRRYYESREPLFTRPSEQAVTEAMERFERIAGIIERNLWRQDEKVEDAKQIAIQGAVALKAAMEAGG